MKLAQNPTFRVEDYPDQRSWISVLFTQLNPFLQSISVAFNQNLDFSNNIPSINIPYSITDFQSFSLKWNFPNYRPAVLTLNQAFNSTQGAYTILLPAWYYNPTDQLITVTNILEATALGNVVLNGKYEFNIRASV